MSDLIFKNWSAFNKKKKKSLLNFRLEVLSVQMDDYRVDLKSLGPLEIANSKRFLFLSIITSVHSYILGKDCLHPTHPSSLVKYSSSFGNLRLGTQTIFVFALFVLFLFLFLFFFVCLCVGVGWGRQKSLKEERNSLPFMCKFFHFSYIYSVK